MNVTMLSWSCLSTGEWRRSRRSLSRTWPTLSFRAVFDDPRFQLDSTNPNFSRDRNKAYIEARQANKVKPSAQTDKKGPK